MYKKLLLTLGTAAAMSAGIHAQTTKPVAVRWIVGETGLNNHLNNDNDVAERTRNDVAERPRIVKAKNEGVKASVAVNIRSAERIAFDMVNQKRVQNGLAPVAWSDELESIARGHSADMAELDYFSHRSLNGKMVSDRADDAHLGRWRSIGENIAFNRGYQDPIAKAVELWMNSPSHKQNLLSSNWKEAAVGVAIAEDGSYYFTQVFLARK